MCNSAATMLSSRSLRSLRLRTRTSPMYTASIHNGAQPRNWKSLAPSPPAGTTTTTAQDALPRLPVPPLESTFTRLKRSLQPIAWSPEEYAAVETKIDAFARGMAPVLQDRLLKRQAETQHWLEEWWDNGGYLGYRDSVVVNVSYFYGFDAHPAHYPQTSAHRAAALTRASLLFRRQYRRGELEPEKTREGPICMDTYRWMFDCCRIPGTQGLDWSVSHARAEDTGDEGHIIVIRRGRVWKVDVAKDGVLLSTADLENQFHYIYENTSQDYPPVGVMSASNRDTWAKDYEHLASSPQNVPILAAINASAFIVSLDPAVPDALPEFSTALWHGGRGGAGLNNRWVDKPLQYVVYDNARAGIMGEHSTMDGTPVARFCDDVLDALASPTFDHGAPSLAPAVPPQALDWHITAQTARAIGDAQAAAAELCDGQTLNVFSTRYGKGAVKRFGFSPDSWAQLVVQLAYARLRASTGGAKLEGGTYEAASTRRFFKGRTEAIRVFTPEAEQWVAGMLNPAVEDEERRRLFGEAAKVHVSLAKEAGKGEGVDRHLLGLRKLLKDGEEMPALYNDAVFARSSTWVLSTSAIFSKHFEAYGWGEVVPNGFGVAYMTGFEDRIFFNITSRTEMPNAQFCDEIRRASDDLYTLFSAKSKL